MKKKNPIWNIRTLLLILALIPTLALALITINLVLNSTNAIGTLGLKLFSNNFSPSPESISSGAVQDYSYGILPALWGTFLVVLISILIAFPISLVLAILANDFSVGFLSPVIRWLIGTLSGIPPIIYALIGSTFFLWFFWPNFGGQGVPTESLPPPGTLPTDASCTLLGGLMLSLLIIPFITPLLDDTIQGVPKSLKEASLSLGANRWYTLKSVTIPAAFPGIVSSLLLGILTALGEAIIVAYTIGLGSRSLPSPLFDVLERTSPLTSTIAGLAGGSFSMSNLVGPVGRSAASFMGLLLLVTAFALLGLTFYLQRRIKKRLAQ